MAICWALLLLLSLLLGSDGALAGDRIKMRKAKAAMAKATRKAARRAEAANPTPPPPPLEEVDPGVVPGTSLRILSYPHPSLRAPNNDITSFDRPLRQLTEEMFSIMYASRGVGLDARDDGAAVEHARHACASDVSTTLTVSLGELLVVAVVAMRWRHQQVCL